MKAWDLIPGNVREKNPEDPTYFQKAKENTLCTQRSNHVGRNAKIFCIAFFQTSFNLFLTFF